MRNGLLHPVAGAIAALALLAWSAAHPAQAERRVALVVGNSSYLHAPALRSPRNDAEDMAGKLRRLSFEVIEAHDLSRSGFAQSLQSFADRLDDADVGLFYYAGHGLQCDGRNFLAATDARLDNEFSIDAETVSLDTVIRLMESRAPVNFVFLDACRNNPLADGLRRNLTASTRSAVVGRGLARIEASDNDTLIVFAAGAGQEAEEGGGRNSPFTLAVLNYIGAPGLEVSVAMKLVTQGVRLATSGRQRPEQLTSMGQLFFFRPARNGSDVAQSLPQDSEVMAALPQVQPTPDQAPQQASAAGRDAARLTPCRAALERSGIIAEPALSFAGHSHCVVADPVRIEAVRTRSGLVRIPARPTVDCPLAIALGAWISEVISPAAAFHLTAPLAALLTGPGYECRMRNRAASGKLSEHGRGRALDLTGLRLADGREILIASIGSSTGAERDFLLAAVTSACGYFTTVLGPGSDPPHADHLHVDLAQRKDRNYRICMGR